MKSAGILLYWVIALVPIIWFVGGCESVQQARTDWQQEKLELQETVKAQEAVIDALMRSDETLLDVFSDISNELAECQTLIERLESEKAVIKKSKQVTPEQLKKGLAEIKALQKAAAERRMKQAAAEVDKGRGKSK